MKGQVSSVFTSMGDGPAACNNWQDRHGDGLLLLTPPGGGD